MQAVSHMPEVPPIPCCLLRSLSLSTDVRDGPRLHRYGIPSELRLTRGAPKRIWIGAWEWPRFHYVMWRGVFLERFVFGRAEAEKAGWMGPRENAERSFNTKRKEIYGEGTMTEWEPTPFTLSGQHMKSFQLFNINYLSASWIHFISRSVKKDTEITLLLRSPQFNKKHNSEIYGKQDRDYACVILHDTTQCSTCDQEPWWSRGLEYASSKGNSNNYIPEF